MKQQWMALFKTKKMQKKWFVLPILSLIFILVSTLACNKANIKDDTINESMANKAVISTEGYEELFAIANKLGIKPKSPLYYNERIKEKYGSIQKWGSFIEMFNKHKAYEKNKPNLNAQRGGGDIVVVGNKSYRVSVYDLNGSYHNFITKCPSTVTIKDFLQAQGFQPPHCDGAGAGPSDLAKILSGTVDQTNQSFLTGSQMQDGYILPCVSYPTSDVIVKYVEDFEGGNGGDTPQDQCDRSPDPKACMCETFNLGCPGKDPKDDNILVDVNLLESGSESAGEDKLPIVDANDEIKVNDDLYIKDISFKFLLGWQRYPAVLPTYFVWLENEKFQLHKVKNYNSPYIFNGEVLYNYNYFLFNHVEGSLQDYGVIGGCTISDLRKEPYECTPINGTFEAGTASAAKYNVTGKIKATFNIPVIGSTSTTLRYPQNNKKFTAKELWNY